MNICAKSPVWLENTVFSGSDTPKEHSLFASHLLCDFLSEVLFLLLDSLAGLEAYEALDGDLRAVLLCYLLYVLAYGLLSVLSLYVYLVKQADLFELFVDAAPGSCPWITQRSTVWDSFGSFWI